MAHLFIDAIWWLLPLRICDQCRMKLTAGLYADPRTAGWPLVQSPIYPMTAATCYIIVCFNARRLAQPLPIFRLRPLLLFYNFMMVLLSCYMTYEVMIVY